MNESSWGAPPGAGRWGPPDQGPAAALRGAAPPAPAGPVHDAGDAAQTRPMPIVPDAGGHQDDDRDPRDIRDDRDHRDDRGAARLSGPLFRDEKPQEPMPTSFPGSPGPESSQDREKPQKKSAGRNLRAAIGVGVGLGVVIVASLFVYKPLFIGVIAVAVVVGLWELTSRLAERKDIRVPLVPLAIGGTAMVDRRICAGRRGRVGGDGAHRAGRPGLADDRRARELPAGRHRRHLRGVLRAVPRDVRGPDARGRRRRPAAGADLPAADGRQRHRCVRGRLALRQDQARAAHQPRQDPRGTRSARWPSRWSPARCAWSS